jgi:hypothetical protein
MHHKHSHWLTYFGALIVFLTFVVKEGLRERWKDTADAIDRAQHAYQDSESRMATSDTLDGIRTELHQLRVRLAPNGPDEQDIEASHADNQANLGSLLTTSENTLTNLDKLAKTVTFSDAIRKRTAEMHDRARDYRAEVDQLRTMKTPRPLTQEYVSQQLSTDLDGARLAIAVIDLDGDTLQEAETIRERNAVYAKYAWWISAALFALGWGLGLLGKLKGVPAAGE